MCKVDLIQMQDFDILKDIFTKIKCHTANLSLFNIRSYIRKYRKFFSRKFQQETTAWLQESKAPCQHTRVVQVMISGSFPCLLSKSRICDLLLFPALGVSGETVTEYPGRYMQFENKTAFCPFLF